jgi:putative colanic acid biosynthesis UDP-glucose lipid carrier transferase
LGAVFIVSDVMAGIIFGYFAARLHDPSSTVVHGVWRDLVLSSLSGALILNKVSCVDGSMRAGTLLRQTLLGSVGTVTVLAGACFVTGTFLQWTSASVLLWAILFLGWVNVIRLFALSLLRLLDESGRVRESVAIIGEDKTVDQLVAGIEVEADVVTVFRQRSGDTLGIGAALAYIAALAREGAVSLVVLAIRPEGRGDLADVVLQHLKAIPVQVALCLETRRANSSARDCRRIAGIPVTVLATRPLSPGELFMKSLLDKIGALLALVLTSPLLFAISAAIYLDGRGTILFRQSRTGWCGRLFTIYKFRTMHELAGSDTSGQTLRADPRCTRVGAFLRRTSLDELPQLWNVLRGEMSLVGPRPHADGLHAAQRTDVYLLREYLRRHRVKPGLTGLAQVHGYRGAADTPEKLRRRIELDLYYIEHWSLWLDIRIIARTPFAVISTENAF